MAVVALAALGMVLGAAGCELLRTKKPDLVAKVEDAAKRLVDSAYASPTVDEQIEDQDHPDRMS